MKMKVAKENYGHPAFLNFMATLKKKRDGGKKDTGKKGCVSLLFEIFVLMCLCFQ